MYGKQKNCNKTQRQTTRQTARKVISKMSRRSENNEETDKHARKKRTPQLASPHSFSLPEDAMMIEPNAPRSLLLNAFLCRAVLSITIPPTSFLLPCSCHPSLAKPHEQQSCTAWSSKRQNTHQLYKRIKNRSRSPPPGADAD
jgi:hypothetical protein